MKRALPKFADRCASTFTNRYNTREAIQSMPTRGRGLIRPRESRTLRRTIKYVHSNTCQCSSRRNCVARYEVGHIKKLSSLPAELAPRSNYMGCILTQRCCQIYPCHRLQHYVRSMSPVHRWQKRTKGHVGCRVTSSGKCAKQSQVLACPRSERDSLESHEFSRYAVIRSSRSRLTPETRYGSRRDPPSDGRLLRDATLDISMRLVNARPRMLIRAHSCARQSSWESPKRTWAKRTYER
jgi:hypothetical protein